MMRRKLFMSCMAALILLGSGAFLGGCAAGQSEGTEKTSTGQAEEVYPTGSLKAVHANGEMENVEEYNNKLCLSCHDRDTINGATENYGGTEGFNPHKSHNAAGDCISCHSVEGTSTLTCNECHNENPPEGWQSAERGSGPLHDLSKEG